MSTKEEREACLFIQFWKKSLFFWLLSFFFFEICFCSRYLIDQHARSILFLFLLIKCIVRVLSKLQHIAWYDCITLDTSSNKTPLYVCLAVIPFLAIPLYSFLLSNSFFWGKIVPNLLKLVLVYFRCLLSIWYFLRDLLFSS